MPARRFARETGQTAAECMGVLLVVAAIVVALFAGHVPGQIACGVQGAIAQITGANHSCDAKAASTASGDSDHDGIPDGIETGTGTDPHNPDSDGDGVTDGRGRADTVGAWMTP